MAHAGAGGEDSTSSGAHINNPLAEHRDSPTQPVDGLGAEERCPIGPAGARAWAVGRRRAAAARTELTLPRRFEIIGRTLHSKAGRPTAFMRCVQACGVAFAISKVISGPHEAAVQAAMAEPNALLYARNFCSGVSIGIFISVLPLSDMGELRNGGTLDRLVAISGDGSVGTSTARKLSCFSNVVSLFGISFLGLTCLLYTQYFGLAMKHPDDAFVTIILLLLGLPPFLVFNLSATVWLLSFRYACAVVRDAVTTVIYSATTVSPLDVEAWNAQVVKPAFELNQSFQLLSKGWSTGLAGLCAGMWTVAFGLIFNILNPAYLQGYDREYGSAPGTLLRTNLILMSVVTPVPLIICMDVATTSSRCDLLLEATNASAIAYGKECHLEVAYLEDRMRGLNKGQGMGFKVGGVILDRSTLKSLAIAIGGGLTTFVTSLLAYTEETAHADQHARTLSETCGGCNLTVSDVAIIADIFDGRDCNWNMTINDILGY